MRGLILCILLLQIAAFCCIQALQDYPNEDIEVTEKTDEFDGKDESFAHCPKFLLDSEEYVMYPNSTIFVMAYNRSYTEPFYAIKDDTVMVCIPSESELPRHNPNLDSYPLHQLTIIGIGVSMVCLVLHLIVFLLVPDLRNLPGCNMASMCVSLFFSYLLMTITNLVDENISACIAVAGLLQFFLLSTFLWMTIIAFDVLRLIHQAIRNLRAASKNFKVRKFLFNNLIAWGIAFVFTAAAMIADNVQGVPEHFQPQFDVTCWFNQKQSLLAFFGGPAFTLFITNFIIFGISAYLIFVNRMKSFPDSHYFNLKRSNVLYFRLAIIVGVTWITGAVAPLINALWIWYLFAALNAFQGLFIFVAFTCTRKVRKHFKKKFFGEGVPKENSKPTVQSDTIVMDMG